MIFSFFLLPAVLRPGLKITDSSVAAYAGPGFWNCGFNPYIGKYPFRL
jgi:hypothetical protein